MKTKKLGLISAIVLAMVFLFALNASAGDNWKTCNVIEAGQGVASAVVKLSEINGEFTNRMFNIDNSNKSAMLATALTAVSNGMQVIVNLSGVNEWSTIQVMRVKP